MRQRADRDKAKQHTERKGRKATAKKAAPEESEDRNSDTDVGSELAALSASVADAVTRVGKRASQCQDHEGTTRQRDTNGSYVKQACSRRTGVGQ